MTKEEYKATLNPLLDEIRILKEKYIEANKKQNVGDRFLLTSTYYKNPIQVECVGHELTYDLAVKPELKKVNGKGITSNVTAYFYNGDKLESIPF